MRVVLLLSPILTFACAAPSGEPQHTSPPIAVRAAVAAVPADAAAPVPPARGARCSGSCRDGLSCLASLPGGYCTSACGSSCDGSCVETPALGELCLAACTRDADCRARDGYTCDPVWHACSLPMLTAIVARQCPTVGPERDASFQPAEAIAVGRDPVAAGSDVMFEVGGTIATPSGIVAEPAAMPALAEVRGGTLAAWRTRDGVIVARSADHFATPQLVTTADDCGDCSAAPLVASNGAIVYVLYGGEDVGLRARRSRDGGATFEPAVPIARGPVASAAVDRGGFLHVVAIRGGVHGGYGSAMQAIEYTAGAALPITVSLRDERLPTFFARPAIAVDDDRKRVWIAYVSGGRDAVWDLVIAVTRDAGKTWLRTRIGDGCAVHAVPSLAIDPKTGTLHVTFYDTEAIPGRYVHATCALAAAPTCTVRGAISPRFAAFGLDRGGPRSLGERAALLIDRGVIHAYWTQPLADGVRVMHAQSRLQPLIAR
ncbi:MAG TPA: sialidase family protein [Kofleriaceae bacterium]